ncbi:Polyketide cyclase / dehydrase and lipid transport [Microbacterium hydrocarbonoxydans]|uniref:Polyketide cyclase / dehydrase and lipid transport n=1 Tax=Microbacterium hydrocarbonoxydans TaxID=273678 RepID=A0A0M2HV29_9MICO|nr:SRPBCC family protein [Microbacterium hydrocarbonoxydans]KJL48760.1 Polyketide cyclase / dehydrase and lipid transport [Microbacterium hydrocarbonoxydans]
MAEFVLETVIAAAPEAVFAASLDPGLHVRSMAQYGETMIEAPEGGVFREGSTVTWRARHFGIPFRLRSLVFDIDRPRRFCDRQISGPFGDFLHELVFEEHPQGTLMRDTITFRSPLGLLGRMVDRLFMREYMRRIIAERNAVLAQELEGRGATAR